MPPDQSPTAKLIGDLAEYLRGEGAELLLVGVAASGYRSKPIRGVQRLLRDAVGQVKLLWGGLWAGPCDWVICLTDPPGLPFTAALLAGLKGAKLAHWAMDVYPDVAVSLGAIRRGLIFKLVKAAMVWAYRRSNVLVALDNDMAAVIERDCGRQPLVLPPWPPALSSQDTSSSSGFPNGSPTNKTKRWLYSGNLGRAHEFEVLLRAQAQLEKSGEDWELVFQGGGPRRAAAQQMAERLGLQQCYFKNYADDSQLLKELSVADVLIATQVTTTQGLLWPSKLALMKLVHRPLLWVGPTNGAVATMLRSLDVEVGLFEPGTELSALIDWLKNQSAREPCQKLVSGDLFLAVERERLAGLKSWSQMLNDTDLNSDCDCSP